VQLNHQSEPNSLPRSKYLARLDGEQIDSLQSERICHCPRFVSAPSEVSKVAGVLVCAASNLAGSDPAEVIRTSR
jgi:hypothetical protein